MKTKKEIEEKYFKTEAMITYLVENVQKYRGQVGKTVVQKLMFLLGNALKKDFGFRFHYYGPYSSFIDGELDNASSILKSVNIRWVDNQGYFITTDEKSSAFTEILSDDEKNEIKSVAEKYGKLSANDLSIITTAYYLIEVYDLSGAKLVHEVGKLKPDDEKDIQEFLEAYGVSDEGEK